MVVRSGTGGARQGDAGVGWGGYGRRGGGSGRGGQCGTGWVRQGMQVKCRVVHLGETGLICHESGPQLDAPP